MAPAADPAIREQRLLERFLLGAGWNIEVFANRVKRAFLKGSDSSEEVELFFTGNEAKARREVNLALETLSQLYEISPEHILFEVRSLAYDLILSRIPTEYVRNESIELSLASTYIRNMKEFLASAATTELSGNRSYKRLLKDGILYSDRCLFGHTFRGSFGFVIESPVGLNDEPSFKGIDDSRPFERRVLERIAIGLNSYDSAVSSESTSPIVSSESGFSANMCDILADTIEEMEVSRLDMKLRLTPEWAAPAGLQASPIFAVERRNVEILRAASKSMREEIAPRQVTVFGRIKRLETDGNPSDLLDDPSTREIEVNWLDEDDRLLHVRCFVSPADYLRAVEAHKEGKIVFATGVLTKSGRSWRLEKVTGFKVSDA